MHGQQVFVGRPLRLAVGGALVYVVALFCCVRIRGNNLLWFCSRVYQFFLLGLHNPMNESTHAEYRQIKEDLRGYCSKVYLRGQAQTDVPLRARVENFPCKFTYFSTS